MTGIVESTDPCTSLLDSARCAVFGGLAAGGLESGAVVTVTLPIMLKNSDRERRTESANSGRLGETVRVVEFFTGVDIASPRRASVLADVLGTCAGATAGFDTPVEWALGIMCRLAGSRDASESNIG